MDRFFKKLPEDNQKGSLDKKFNEASGIELLKLKELLSSYVVEIKYVKDYYSYDDEKRNKKTRSELGLKPGDTFQDYIRIKGYRLDSDILKLHTSSIRIPEEKGSQNILGLLIPTHVHSMYVSISNPELTINQNFPKFGVRDNYRVISVNMTMQMRVFGGPNDDKVFKVMVRYVPNQDITDFIGTYELGQLIEGSVGITLDMKNVDTPLFDPSEYFEP